MRQKNKGWGKPRASGYSEAGASLHKRALRGFKANSGSPAMDINWNNMTLRQRARMLYMAAPVATAAVNTQRTKVVGMGLTLKSSVNIDVLGITPEAAKSWQKKTEAEWNLWAGKKQNCDALGLNSFVELQQLALISWLLSGDVFPLFKRYEPTRLNPYSLRIHLIEADRVSTPMSFRTGGYLIGATDGKAENGNLIHDGVEVDSEGRVVAYHICNCYPFEFVDKAVEWTRVEAYGKATGLPNILHVMDAERRPIPWRPVPSQSHRADVTDPEIHRVGTDGSTYPVVLLGVDRNRSEPGPDSHERGRPGRCRSGSGGRSGNEHVGQRERIRDGARHGERAEDRRIGKVWPAEHSDSRF